MSPGSQSGETKKVRILETPLQKPLQLYVKRADQVRGPLTVEQLRQLATTNRIRPDDLVGKSSNGPWQVASNVRGLQFPAPELDWPTEPVPVQQPQPQVVYVHAPAPQAVQIVNQVNASATAVAVAGGRRGMSAIAAVSIVLSAIGCLIAWVFGSPTVGAAIVAVAMLIAVIGAVVGLFVGGFRDSVAAVILAVIAFAICAAAPQDQQQKRAKSGSISAGKTGGQFSS